MKPRPFASRIPGQPRPGLFKIRRAKGAVWVAAKIVHEPTRDPETGEPLARSPEWCAVIDNCEVGGWSPTPSGAVLDVWTYGVPIGRAEYEFLVADREWARDHRPDLPEARPAQRVDLNALPPLF